MWHLVCAIHCWHSLTIAATGASTRHAKTLKRSRLSAISYLPLGADSLKYGSRDGGATVHAELDELNADMARVGAFLNLAPHHVGRQVVPMALCGDIEGHVGDDGHFYCLDFARIFPPERLPKTYVSLCATPLT